MQQRMLLRICSVLLCCAAAAPAAAELTPQQITVVVNHSGRESVKVGPYYAKQCGAPDTHVIQKIVRPLRQALENRGLAGQIRAFTACLPKPTPAR